MKHDFTKEKIAVTHKISNVFFDTELKFGIDQGDVFTDTMTAKLKSYIYTNMAEERDLVYYTPKPTFMDWLFRRTKRVVFKLEVKDILLNPPSKKDTLRIYLPTLEEE